MTTDPRTTAELRAEAARLQQLADARDRQLTREDLAGMSADDITTAKATGQLDELLGINRTS